ncbi:MAG: hypothetical protein E5W03_00330 [Mesorhizobium sp.]|nr:MAG: hypothetical protein E5W03_00330 [Mesorhizobium sp.]TIV25133.1 MAG: hypothetical protein E5W02_00515 [Mesorhizobium sp.]
MSSFDGRVCAARLHVLSHRRLQIGGDPSKPLRTDAKSIDALCSGTSFALGGESCALRVECIATVE